MLTTIARIFGKSPFHPLQLHMKKVCACMKKLTDIFEALDKFSKTELKSAAKDLSKLEYEADLTKNDIRNHLPKSLFLPIDRGQFLNLLALQDAIADKTEEIGHLLSLHQSEELTKFYPHFTQLFYENKEAFESVRQIIEELHQLLEASFGGVEAEKVKGIIEKTSKLEYQADKLKYQLMSEFFEKGNTLSPISVYLYTKLVQQISDISHICEKLANHVRIILELK